MIFTRPGGRMLPLLLCICLLTPCITVHAQLKWPSISRETRPWTRWWWEGSAVDAPGLRFNLEAYKRAGLGGVEITPIYGVHGAESRFINFLSPQWMAMLDSTLAISKKLNLGVDLANATGWPFGGPWISDADAAKTLLHQRWTVKGGASFNQSLILHRDAFVRTANNKNVSLDTVRNPPALNKNLQDLALDQVVYATDLKPNAVMAYGSKGTILAIDTIAGHLSQLNWKAPEGQDWTLIAVYSALHGKMVERAAPGGEGYAIDHFSKAAADHYFSRFDQAFKGHDLSYLRAFFNDSYEVDDARGQSNWTPDFLQQFRRRKGYDLLKELPALFGEGEADHVNRVVYDYRSTIDELILEHFTQTWKNWGGNYKALVRNQSHGSPANTLDLYAAVDIPETEGTNIMRFKFASSAAHVTGKPLASSESCTWLNEHFKSSWGDVKKAIDLYFLGGVNHIFYHGSAYSPKDAAWPGWLFYAAVHFQPNNPQWKDFGQLNEYITRVQSFLQQGDADNDILLYYPIEDRYMQPGRDLLQHFDGMEKNFEGSDFEHVANWMQEQGYSFDFFSARQLEKFRVFNGRVVTGGHAYKAILLPANQYMDFNALSKLVALSGQGAKILVYKNLPSSTPGLAYRSARQSVIDQVLRVLEFKDDSARLAQGAWYRSQDLGFLMQKAGARKDGMLQGNLQTIRRRNGDGYTYFINNRSDAMASSVELEVKPVSVAIFDPMTGEAGLAGWELLPSGKTRVRLHLKPWQALLIRTYDRKTSGEKFRNFTEAGSAISLSGDWQLKFLSGGPSIPPTVVQAQTDYWSNLKEEAYQSFSGTAEYSLKFNVEHPRSVDYYRLVLPEVRSTAEVFLNGKKLCTLIGPDFSYEFPSTMLNAHNEIRIVVSNLMANRIRYMDQHQLPWEIFYNTNMPARFKENSVNGLFSAASWPVMESGMKGVVRLQPLAVE